MYALKRGWFVSIGAMTWRLLLRLGVLALLVAVQGCGGDKQVDAVAPDQGMAQVSPSSAAPQNASSQQPAAQPAAQSRSPLPHGSSDELFRFC